jgi:WhiB family redox-sensing transcriptional regulator
MTRRVEWGRVVMRSDKDVDTGWMAKAACQDHPTDLFFFDERVERTRVAEAKAICHKCPVWKNCLDYAIETPVDFGIWGGYTSRERVRHRWNEQRRNRKRNAPKTNPEGAR